MITTASAPIEKLHLLSASDRIKALRELLLVCYADGQLDEPLRVTNDRDPFVGIIFAMFPKGGEPPEMTPEQIAETQRRIDNPVRLNREEFIAAVRRARAERGKG